MADEILDLVVINRICMRSMSNTVELMEFLSRTESSGICMSHWGKKLHNLRENMSTFEEEYVHIKHGSLWLFPSCMTQRQLTWCRKLKNVPKRTQVPRRSRAPSLNCSQLIVALNYAALFLYIMWGTFHNMQQSFEDNSRVIKVENIFIV